MESGRWILVTELFALLVFATITKRTFKRSAGCAARGPLLTHSENVLVCSNVGSAVCGVPRRLILDKAVDVESIVMTEWCDTDRQPWWSVLQLLFRKLKSCLLVHLVDFLCWYSKQCEWVTHTWCSAQSISTWYAA